MRCLALRVLACCPNTKLFATTLCHQRVLQRAYCCVDVRDRLLADARAAFSFREVILASEGGFGKKQKWPIIEGQCSVAVCVVGQQARRNIRGRFILAEITLGKQGVHQFSVCHRVVCYKPYFGHALDLSMFFQHFCSSTWHADWSLSAYIPARWRDCKAHTRDTHFTCTSVLFCNASHLLLDPNSYVCSKSLAVGRYTRMDSNSCARTLPTAGCRLLYNTVKPRYKYTVFLQVDGFSGTNLDIVVKCCSISD